MASWDLRRLQMHLQKGTPLPIYVVVGEDYFLVNEAVQGLKQTILADGAVDFNYDQFFAGDDDTVKIRDTIEMLPMMSARRMVLVRQVHQWKEKDWGVIESLLREPVDSTALVLVADKIDKRKKIFKILEEKAATIELKRPYDNQLAVWIEYIAAKHGMKIQPEAVSLLRQLIGANLTELNNSVLKLQSFLGEEKNISAESVLRVVSRSRVDNVFELTNAIGRQDRAGALQALANLLDQGQSEVGAVAMIARHLRVLSAIQEGAKGGLSPAQICAKVGIPQFFLKDYQSQVRFWPESKMNRTVVALKNTDKALKSSPLSAHIWLENFIVHSCT